MPSAFIHYFFGIVLSSALGYDGRDRLLLASLSLLPDMDFVSLIATRHIFRVTQNHPLLGRALFHRGITHTFLFALSVPPLFLLFGDARLALLAFLSLLFHLFWDWVSIWGINPLFPFRKRNYALNVFSIGDVPATILLSCAALGTFYSRTLLLASLAAFLAYLAARFCFKLLLVHRTGAAMSSIVPTSTTQYAFAMRAEGVLHAGRTSLLPWGTRTKAVSSDRDRENELGHLLGGMGKTFVEFPVFVPEGKGIRIFDARRVLFDNHTPFSMMFYVEGETVFIETGWGKLRIPPSWVSW